MSAPNVYSTPSVFIIVPPIPGQQIGQGINTKAEIIQGKMLVPTHGNTYLMHKLVTWKITMEFTKFLWSKINVASISNASNCFTRKSQQVCFFAHLLLSVYIYTYFTSIMLLCYLL